MAINQALDIRGRVPVDIWAFWDHPSRIIANDLEQYIYAPLCVWTGCQQFYELSLDGEGRTKRVAWEEAFPPTVGFRHLDKFLLPDPIKGSHRAGFSLIYILEKCLRLGAKKIRVLSCNMEGPWVPGTTTEEASKAVNRWDRWLYERTQVRTMCFLAREKRGCEIEIHGIDMDAYLKGGEWKKVA